MNNLVTSLLEIKCAEARAYTYANSRRGWIFTSIAGVESMHLREPGKFEVIGKLNEPLIVREIPEMVFPGLGYTPSPFLKGFGRFDWKYLESIGIFNNVNVILEREPDPGFDIAAWRASGKQIRTRESIHSINPKTTAECLKELRGMHEPYDGIIISEINGLPTVENNINFPLYEEGIRELKTDKLIIPYMNLMYKSVASTKFLNTLLEHGNLCAEERYLGEKPTLREARKDLYRMTQNMNEYKKAIPGIEKQLIFVLGYMSAPPETLNRCPNVNYKVWLDLQMHEIVNNSAYKGMYGVMMYHSAYADEEILRWSVKLFRHYCIEGNRGMLSTDPYVTQHILNGDFNDGYNYWNLAGSNFQISNSTGYGYLQGRYPFSTLGDSFLVMLGSTEQPNIASQMITGLQVGRLYSLKMFVTDAEDMLNELDNKYTHEYSVEIDDVDLIANKSFQEIYPSGLAGHAYGTFNRTNNLWITFHRLVFRAHAGTALLTISDWIGGQPPGIPHQLAFNGFEVEPYLEY